MEDLSHLPAITGPKEIALGRAWPVIENDGAGRSLPDRLEIPELSRRHLQDRHFPLDGKVLRRLGHPVEKWAPDTRRLLPVQPVEQHGNLDAVVRAEKRSARPSGD